MRNVFRISLPTNWGQLQTSKLGKMSGFSLVFAFVKLNAFTAVLFLSHFTESVAEYGLFEYALSVGLLASVILNAGQSNAYPFFTLKKVKKRRKVFYLHGLLIGVLCLIAAFCTYLLEENAARYAFIALISGIITLQALASSILKTHGKIYNAVFFDGGLFIILNACNLFLYLTNSRFNADILIIGFAIYLMVLILFFAFRFFKERADFQPRHYLETLSFGKNVLFSAFLIMTLTGSARILLEKTAGLEAVGFYGFYFRFAAITVMIHQVVNIVFFKEIYQYQAPKADRFFTAFIWSITGIGILLYFILPPLLVDHFTLLRESFSQSHSLYLGLTFQMIFWIAMALNENLIYREELASSMNRAFLPLVLLFIFLVFTVNSFFPINASLLVLINILILFLATEIQTYLLKKKHTPLPHLRTSLRVLFAIFSGWYLYFI